MIDLQSTQSTQQIYLNEVGVRNLVHPVQVQMRDRLQPSIATFNMGVGLPADQRGTHMSRFVEILNQKDWALSVTCMQELLVVNAERFKADKVIIHADFPLFMNKAAPVSKTMGYLDYQASLHGVFSTNKNQTHNCAVTIGITVPITLLCPCSKEISEYGAHNQRAHVKVFLTTTQNVCFEDLIQIVESEASCEIYSVLKRVDEKYVTEKAYNTPRFVEDVARNVAAKIKELKLQFMHYKVEAESFESIHNHSAYATIAG